MFDTRKAYNSIKTGLAERHLCRLWYHDCQDEDWRIDDFNCGGLEKSSGLLSPTRGI